MITDAILAFLMFLPKQLIEALPILDATLTVPNEVGVGFASLFYGLAYMLPLKGLIPILIYRNAFLIFRIGMAIATLIKSFIPTMGGT